MDAKKLQELSKSITILYVEDDENIAQKLILVLEQLFKKVTHVQDGQMGLDVYKKDKFDIVLSDISMPNINGIDMAKEIKNINPGQKLIFSTAHSESKLLMEAINLNADGYILKPINHNYFLEMLYKVSKAIKTTKDLEYYQQHLEIMVVEKTKELQFANTKLTSLNNDIHNTLESTILSLGGVAEARSHETGLHVNRVAIYSEFLAKKLGLNEKDVDTIRIISPMHDIGKLAIEDSILKKPAKLTDKEYTRMKMHAQLGYEMLSDSNLPLFKDAAIVAYEHHEKWDGTGYPKGLKGEEIHIYGRITGFADVFDALISERVYKKSWPIEKIIDFVKEEKGKHFDPAICDIFLDNVNFFHRTYLENIDIT